MTENVKRLNDLMAGIYGRLCNGAANGSLRVHTGNDGTADEYISIDLYDDDGAAVCDGLDFEARHPETQEMTKQTAFCVCYFPQGEPALHLLCDEKDKDTDDWSMNPADVSDSVIKSIADWIGSRLTKMWTIKRWSKTNKCTEYLYRLHPVRFIGIKEVCLKIDATEVARISDHLNNFGIEHEVIEVEGNH